MTQKPVFHSILLTASVLVLAACAAQPATPLLEKKFQRAATNYRVIERDGQTLYCAKEKPISSAVAMNSCLTEAQVRDQVAMYERTRETSIGTPIRPGAGQGAIGD